MSLITLCVIESKEGVQYQESIQLSITVDPMYHMGMWQNTRKPHTR